MDLITLANNIITAATQIDAGRKGFATKERAEEGRISYETGISAALSAFQEASNQGFATTTDSQTIILAEYTFISQELEFCEKNDKDSLSSLTQAIQSFDDAFLALQAVEEAGYKTAEKTYPHSGKYRFSGFPKDAFHTACIAHKTRLQNVLRAPGIDPIEKSLLKQRLANLSTAQGGYVEMQRKALTK